MGLDGRRLSSNDHCLQTDDNNFNHQSNASWYWQEESLVTFKLSLLPSQIFLPLCLVLGLTINPRPWMLGEARNEAAAQGVKDIQTSYTLNIDHEWVRSWEVAAAGLGEGKEKWSEGGREGEESEASLHLHRLHSHHKGILIAVRITSRHWQGP